MKRIALVELRLGATDQLVFQRRDGNAPTSPYLLGFFGGGINPGEQAGEAAVRELGEETSLDAGGIAMRHAARLDLPHGLGGMSQALELNLFSATVTDAGFTVYEGVGSEVYGRDDALERDDLTPTARYLLERGY